MDTKGESIDMPPPPIRALNEGDRRPVGVAHITLTANLSSYREVPDGVPVPLATGVVLPPPPPPPPATIALFLTVHPQATAPFHSPNQTPLLPKANPSPHYRKWALMIARQAKRQSLFLPAALSKARFCPRHHRLRSSHRLKPLRNSPLVLPMCPHGPSQKFFRPLPQWLLRHQALRNDGLCGKSASRKFDVITSDVTFTPFSSV